MKKCFGIISKGVTDIEIYQIKDEYVITAKEIKRTNHGNGEFSVEETGTPILYMSNEQDLPERERNVSIVVEIES